MLHLFMGSEQRKKLAAMAYRLIKTAKLNNDNSQAWLADVLAKIADQMINHIYERLPWHYA